MRPYMPALLVGCIITALAVGQSQFPQPTQSKDIGEIEAVPTDVDATILIKRDDGQAAQLAVTSPAVHWQGNDLHIARIGRVRLVLNEDNVLTARVNAGLLTFDDVDVTIHAAVFDGDGMLLGTATAVEHVQRVWLGVPALMARDVALDFGICACYEDIHSISAAATHGAVLTPEQWMNDDSEADE